MRVAEQPVLRDIVLVGGGHSHVVVLGRFAMRPEPGIRLTLICTDTHTPYSGMLPGYIAGHYSYDQVHIDLRRLAGFAGARYFRDEVVGLDRAQRKVLCRHRPPVAYDRVSINIGSMPAVECVEGAAEHAIPVKPIRRFNERWLALLERVRRHAGRTTIAVVGAGAGGVELTLAMQYRLRGELRSLGRDPDELRFHLFSAARDILPTHNASVRRSFERVLAARGVVIHRAAEVCAVISGQLSTDAGETLAADEIVWVTQAGGAAWLRATGLALDDSGFIEVQDSLQTVSDTNVFAAGDCAAMRDTPLEKAGVFAVRQGRPLAENLRRSLLGQPLRAYRPQARWLALISTGDRYAVASRAAAHVEGAWVWRWKDWIDRRFMTRFNDLPARSAPPRQKAAAVPLDQAEAAQAISALAMRCGGCGAKVGATVLSRALSAVQPLERDDVLIGLHAPDDAAIVRVPSGKALVHSVDFFRAFIDDPWLFGRIAANHALGDIFAMGAEAQSATAIATLPPGLESQVEETLLQMMSGAVEVLNDAGCALVGGHSGEGSELALGFAINGLIDEGLDSLMCKGGMRPGERLILNKPIGTGTLFAAHARLRASGRWIDEALASMQQSNRLAAQCLREHGATACTDLSGFGLLGHLIEMTRASGVDAEIDLAALPILDGAVETSAAGILSSLQAANLHLRRALRNDEQGRAHASYPLLFDPQTAGGLLASVPAERASACLVALRSLAYARATCIGRVLAADDGLAPIRLRL
ncbi:MAG: selenide, water dikinase SelD [Candidatus Accumulibacter sp.]|uniref:selenide, water dikinase SelD n=1 Tax=Accumulibacter sp. TaxID=2053492 RepID=UPI001D8E6660|nr:selenide, water dikinase SelD [Accumulibacter sp.]MCB1942983.1 selenide, water dikinase SelD [Accumulibacter sp.]MCP5248956.1 selenide, water dikinase SelD [Accumulibacter sp.]